SIPFARLEPASLNHPIDAALYTLLSARHHLIGNVVEQNVKSGLRGDLSDASSHLAGADYPECVQPHQPSSLHKAKIGSISLIEAELAAKIQLQVTQRERGAFFQACPGGFSPAAHVP